MTWVNWALTAEAAETEAPGVAADLVKDKRKHTTKTNLLKGD